MQLRLIPLIAFSIPFLLTGCTAKLPPDTIPTLTPTDEIIATPSSEPTMSRTPEPNSTIPDANIVFVKAVETAPGVWRFDVTVQHPDTGWEDYADGWDVLLPDGTVLKANESDPYTRVLLHPHVDEQPFTRSQSNLKIPSTINTVIVRAHDLISGFGGAEITLDLNLTEGNGYQVQRSPNE